MLLSLVLALISWGWSSAKFLAVLGLSGTAGLDPGVGGNVGRDGQGLKL